MRYFLTACALCVGAVLAADLPRTAAPEGAAVYIICRRMARW